MLKNNNNANNILIFCKKILNLRLIIKKSKVMKNFYLKFGMMSVGFFMMCGISSCNMEDDLTGSGQIQDNYVSQLVNAVETGAYVATEVSLYDCPTGETEWEEIDLMGYYGWSAQTPGILILDNGKAHTPVSFFSCSHGPDVFSWLWYSYVKKTYEQSIYMGQQVSYDSESNILKIGNIKYEVLEFTQNSLVLAYDSPYGGGKTGNGGLHREIRKYKSDNSMKVDSKTIYSFDSMFEVYHFVIDKGHELFGERVNLNSIYKNQIIFPQDYLEIGELERLLAAMEERNTLEYYDLIKELDINLPF